MPPLLPVLPVEEGVTPGLAQVAGTPYPTSKAVQRTLGDTMGGLMVSSFGAMLEAHEDTIES